MWDSVVSFEFGGSAFSADGRGNCRCERRLARAFVEEAATPWKAKSVPASYNNQIYATETTSGKCQVVRGR